MLVMMPTMACCADIVVVDVSGESQLAVSVVVDLARDFCRAKGLPPSTLHVQVAPLGKSAIQSAQANRRWDVTVIVGDCQYVAQDNEYVIGEWRAAVVAGVASNVQHMTVDELRDSLRSRESEDGKAVTRSVFFCAEAKINLLRQLLREGCMRFREHTDWGYRSGWYLFRRDIVVLYDARECRKILQSSPDSIGLMLCGNALDLRGMRVIRIANASAGPFIAADMGKGCQPGYPLTQRLLVRAKKAAPALAKAFAEYCLTAPAAKIAAQHGLITQWDVREAEGEQRLAEAKALRGARIAGVGMDAFRAPFRDMTTEYVRAKEVVQLSYAVVDADVSAVGAFVTGGEGVRELLGLDGKPSSQAMQLYGRQWRALGLGGTGPRGGVLGGRAAVVIAHAMNKIEVLATGQVREPFGPRARSWKAFSGVDAEIRRYCPISTDPATKLFHEKVLPLSQCGPMVRKKTSAEVIAAVSMDPQGIGFVDYTAIRKDNKRFGPERLTAEGSIKVLGIVTDKGIVRPEPKTILDGTWPISQQYYLYVNPKASETAKDFAKFIVSGACADVFRKHGMVPAPPQKLEFPTTQPEPGE